jgi:hypothetical protein
MANYFTHHKRIIRWEKIKKFGKLKCCLLIGLAAFILFSLSRLLPIEGFKADIISFNNLIVSGGFGLYWVLVHYFYLWNQTEKKYLRWVKEMDEVKTNFEI